MAACAVFYRPPRLNLTNAMRRENLQASIAAQVERLSEHHRVKVLAEQLDLAILDMEQPDVSLVIGSTRRDDLADPMELRDHDLRVLGRVEHQLFGKAGLTRVGRPAAVVLDRKLGRLTLTSHLIVLNQSLTG